VLVLNEDLNPKKRMGNPREKTMVRKPYFHKHKECLSDATCKQNLDQQLLRKKYDLKLWFHLHKHSVMPPMK
jgi:hypothetical protein